jgi:hypothetical protein
LYYLAINLFGELSYRVFDNIIKVKYEDIISNTAGEMGRILRFAAPQLGVPATVPDTFDMPHIVGGNRMKSEKVIQIDQGIKWRGRMPMWKQIMYYLAALPFMMINRYTP